MPTTSEKASRFFDRIDSPEETIEDIRNKGALQLPRERIPAGETNAENTAERLEFLRERGHTFQYLTGEKTFDDIEDLHGNIENYIGMSMVPTGVIGPLHIVGTAAQGDFYVPLATSEGALVASYDRGARVTRMAGRITSI